MSCEIARRMMDTNDPALERHRATCSSCILGAQARYYEAPAALAEKIRQDLRRENRAPMPWRWAALAASVLLAAAVAWNLAQVRSRVSEEVLSAHLRSLAGTHLLDVPSSDQHTVKPWFNGKLDFSPPVKELPGFPLLGGRVEYFDGHPAAALVYGRRNHVINLFIWPSAARSRESTETRNGFHLRDWAADGMTFWVISDLNDAELGEFVSAYRRE